MKSKLTDLTPALLDLAFDANEITWSKAIKDTCAHAGNTAAWFQAYSRTACILGFVDRANTDEVKGDMGIVRAAGTPEAASAWSQYRGLITFAKSELIATYGRLSCRADAGLDRSGRAAKF